jgi:hypothetical protein
MNQAEDCNGRILIVTLSTLPLILVLPPSLYLTYSVSQITKMSSIQLINLQVLIALIGMVWKLKEGYPLAEVPDFLRLFKSVHRESGYQWLYIWLEILGGISIESMMDDWPWFSLHLFLYISQLIPFIVIIINESPSGRRAWSPFRYVILNCV